MNRVNIRIHNSTCTKLLQFFFKIKRTLDRGQRVHLTLLSELCIQTLFRNPVAEFSATHFFSRFSCQADFSSIPQRAAQLKIISTFQSYRRPSGQHSSLLLAQREAFHPPKLQNSLQRRTGGATPWLVQRAKIERAEHSWRTLVGWGAQVSWL